MATKFSIARKVICELEDTLDVSQEVLNEYADSNSEKHEQMVKAICKQMNFTSLRYYKLEDLIEAIGLSKDKLCTYCFNGKE